MFSVFKILFFNTLILSTLIAISSSTWLCAWIGLEINLLSMMPLLSNQKNKYPAESAMKYFIAQVTASSMVIFSVIFTLAVYGYIPSEMSNSQSMLVSSSLLMKMGAAPFHFWYPEVVSGLNWWNNFILLSWQKIAPMILLIYQMEKHTLFFSVIIILSSMVSGLQGMNQICLRKIMAYSSINHLSWMIASLMNSCMIWVYYFSIYCFINMNIILILKKYNIFFLKQMANIFTQNKKIKILFMLNFLSLGGLPPFLGFLPKWLTINKMVENSQYTTATMLIIFTLVSLYFYMRITFSSFSVNSQESMIILFNKINYFHFMVNLFSLIGLITCSLIDSSM